MRTRLILAATLATALLSFPALVAAHAPLLSSTPKAGENLDTAPTEVTLSFGGELDPDGSSFTVKAADGTKVGTGELDLTVADRNVLTGKVTISDPGVYTVAWTSKSIDGAVLNGTFSFGFSTDATIPGATGGEDNDDDAPNTAVPAPQPPVMAIAGLLLLAAAGGLVLRRVMVR